MASVLFTIGDALVNALAFSGTNFVFSRLTYHGVEERKRHDLALEKLQRARDEWNRDRMKHLDFINKRLREENEAKTYINNVDEALLEYYRVFAKQIIPYHLSLNYQIFIIHQRIKKMVSYYLLWWVQALQDIRSSRRLRLKNQARLHLCWK